MAWWPKWHIVTHEICAIRNESSNSNLNSRIHSYLHIYAYKMKLNLNSGCSHQKEVVFYRRCPRTIRNKSTFGFNFKFKFECHLTKMAKKFLEVYSCTNKMPLPMFCDIEIAIFALYKIYMQNNICKFEKEWQNWQRKIDRVWIFLNLSDEFGKEWEDVFKFVCLLYPVLPPFWDWIIVVPSKWYFAFQLVLQKR